MKISRAFKVLGLGGDASPTQMRPAYKQLVKRFHPDRFAPSDPQRLQAEELMKTINAAYTALSRHFKEPRQRVRRSAQQAAGPGHPATARAFKTGRTTGAAPNACRHAAAPKAAAFCGTGRPTLTASRARAASGRQASASTFHSILSQSGVPAAMTAKHHPGKPWTRRRHKTAHPIRSNIRGTATEGIKAVTGVDPVQPVKRVRGIGRTD